MRASAQVTPQLSPSSMRRRGFGAASVLQTGDTFSLQINISAGGSPAAQGASLLPFPTSGVQISPFGDYATVTGTYTGTSPVNMPTWLGYTAGGVTYMYPVDSSVVTPPYGGRNVVLTAPSGTVAAASPGGRNIVLTMPPVASSGTTKAAAPPSAPTTSSKTPYYVAGGVAVAALGTGAWWMWFRKG
jgi:hypothetical protein